MPTPDAPLPDMPPPTCYLTIDMLRGPVLALVAAACSTNYDHGRKIGAELHQELADLGKRILGNRVCTHQPTWDDLKLYAAGAFEIFLKRLKADAP